MAHRFTVFVSSTVRDFGPVRTDIRRWLESRGIDVRMSEEPSFPVRPGVHSLDACLHAIDGCHVFVLLVGARYGNRHLNTTQSITWAEHDEAVKLDIPVIKLILREVNEEAVRFVKAEKGGRKPSPPSEIDPRVFAFIEAIRKGKRDNWTHSDWDGSFNAARERIDSRLNSLFVAYQGRHGQLQEAAERFVRYCAARNTIDAIAALAASKWQGLSTAREATEKILLLLVEFRNELFGFEPSDRYNFVVYARKARKLVVVARKAHPAIRRKNRSWALGQGHVGVTAETGETLVAPRLRHTASHWEPGHASDEKNYSSVVAVPCGTPANPTAVQGVFIVTSSRQDQFRDVEQREVLTAESMGLTLSQVGAFGLSALRRGGTKTRRKWK